MKVLIACEFSGLVRDAFIANGAEALSCDLEPSERPGPHYQGNVLDILSEGWDLMVGFPPCTYLANSGSVWWKNRQEEQKAAIEFWFALWNAPIPRIVIENPVDIISRFCKPHQKIQPWQFGHEETKKTCLWLKGVPHLKPTLVVAEGEQRINSLGQTSGRQRERSRTYDSIAKAMGTQWTQHVIAQLANLDS